jgi:hypothetical protein
MKALGRMTVGRCAQYSSNSHFGDGRVNALPSPTFFSCHLLEREEETFVCDVAPLQL